MLWSHGPNHTFRHLPISPLIFATVQKIALDYLRDQQILTPTCEWGWAVVVPLLNMTIEVEDSQGMVCTLYTCTLPCAFVVILLCFETQIVLEIFIVKHLLLIPS